MSLAATADRLYLAHLVGLVDQTDLADLIDKELAARDMSPEDWDRAVGLDPGDTARMLAERPATTATPAELAAETDRINR